jgi:hypothetical protein
MFTLSSTDLNIPHKSNQEIHIPIRFKSSDEKFSKERITHDTIASCDDNGHIFVYDSNSNQESTSKSDIFLLKLILSLILFSYITKKN